MVHMPALVMPKKWPSLHSLLLVISMLASSHASAQNATTNPLTLQSDSYLQAIGTQSFTYDTNPLMLTNGAKTLYGSVTAPELVLYNTTPTSQLMVDGVVQKNIFNQSEFDSTDLHSKILFNTKNERWSADLKQTIDYDTTRTSEFSNYGFITAPVRHIGINVSPTIGFKPTATDTISLPASLTTSHYERRVFTDFTVMSASPNLKHEFDPNNTGVFTFKAQRYRATTGPRNVVDSVGPSIGWIRTLSPLFSINGNIGIQQSRQFGSIASRPWELQYTFDGGLNYEDLQDRLQFTARRANYAFGNGTDSLLTTFGVTDTHKINPRLSVNFGLNYQTADYQAQTVGSLETMITGNGGITYNVTPYVDLSSTFQYRRETLTNISQTADSSIITIGIVFHPQAWDL